MATTTPTTTDTDFTGGTVAFVVMAPVVFYVNVDVEADGSREFCLMEARLDTDGLDFTQPVPCAWVDGPQYDTLDERSDLVQEVVEAADEQSHVIRSVEWGL